MSMTKTTCHVHLPKSLTDKICSSIKESKLDFYPINTHGVQSELIYMSQESYLLLYSVYYISKTICSIHITVTKRHQIG